MTFPVVWQQTARESMAALLRFVAEQNPDAARDLKIQIESAAQSLSELPYRARRGRVVDTRELLAHPNYWIIYRVTLTAVEIVEILHTRREYP
ncbi:MAG: type II toxin-antitoxin system RelE/ParE family toxin [Xanthomonadaceae bacterium]|nr:type II toxin-antitoxin system RelE/ParE family toxin [Xanthomonadaceae bacterium]